MENENHPKYHIHTHSVPWLVIEKFEETAVTMGHTHPRERGEWVGSGGHPGKLHRHEIVGNSTGEPVWL